MTWFPKATSSRASQDGNPSPNLLSITIAGIPVQVHFAGVVAAGLYQFNVVVPSVAAGDQPVAAAIAHAQET